MVKRSVILMALAGAISFVFIASVSAAGQAVSDAQLSKDAAILDDQATNAKGSAAIVQTIESMFNVTKDQIDALRADRLGYGGIVILLSLAQSTSAGVTPDSINQILALRQGPPVLGWGQIAEKPGLNLGKVVSAVAKATDRSAQGNGQAPASNNGSGNGIWSGAAMSRVPPLGHGRMGGNRP